jgi:hypothetical protein
MQKEVLNAEDNPSYSGTNVHSCFHFGQDNNRENERRAVLVPMDIYPLVAASQPVCPLKVELVTLLKYVDGRLGKSYVVRNTSSSGPGDVQLDSRTSRTASNN